MTDSGLTTRTTRRYHFGRRSVESLKSELDAWTREVDSMRGVEADIARDEMQAIRNELANRAEAAALTDAELRERLDDALLAEHEPVDDMTTDVEYRENLPNLIRALMDETHERALREALRRMTSLDRAAAILAHIRKHGHEHLSTISVAHEARVLLWEPFDESAIAALRPWHKSIGAETVQVTKIETGPYQIKATGTIEPGLTIEVDVITREAETAALDKVIEKYTQSLRKFPIRLLDACERPIPRDHIPSPDCWCEPTFDQDGQFHKHPTYDGLPAKFEPPIVPGAEQDADGYAREDHR